MITKFYSQLHLLNLESLKTAKSLGIKVSKIGKIHSNMKESTIIDENGNKIRTYFKGYEHQF